MWHGGLLGVTLTALHAGKGVRMRARRGVRHEQGGCLWLAVHRATARSHAADYVREPELWLGAIYHQF